MDNYKEITINMGELQDGDLVFCSDGQWHKIKVLSVQTPKFMFKLHFKKDGNEKEYIVDCSGDHMWTLYNGSSPIVVETETIFYNLDFISNFHVGVTNSGIHVVNIEQIEPVESRCIHIIDLINEGDPKYLLFEVNAKSSDGDILPVMTHNCMEKIVCGQLGGVASRMALDNMDATTIDGKHKGAGIVKAQGVISHIQYYFEQVSWLWNWFKDRGMTEKGYDPNGVEEDEIDPNEIDLGDDDEEFTIETNTTTMDFAGIHKEIDNSQDQKFSQI